MALVTNIPITSATVEQISRHEMLMWVNECLQAEFAKLEQVLFPGTIQMKKVKFNSRLELDWLSNWKIVQNAWKQLGVEKVIPVERLIKGKFQDNFEFLQWFKKFFDANYDGHAYNPVEMRNFEELPKEGKLKPTGGSSLKMPQETQKKTISKPLAPQRAGSNASVNSSGASAVAKKTSTGPTPKSKAAPTPTMTNSAGRTAPPKPPSPKQQPAPDLHLIEELKHKNVEMEELRNQLAESDEVIAGLERERDFYFAKLRRIEVLCQDHEPAGTLEVSSILQILYETEEGFAPPEEGGQTNGGGGGEETQSDANGAI